MFKLMEESPVRMPMFLFLALFSVSLAEVAGANTVPIGQFKPFIIGGVEVEPQDLIAATTVAIMGQDDEGQFLCSGSILDQDLVVTAGHCLGDSGKAALSIYFRANLKGQGPIVVATGALRPQQYTGGPDASTNMYDIALVHFNGGLPAGYQPVKLLDNANSLRDGEQVTLAGFGVTQADADSFDTSGAGTLRKVNVNILQAKMPSTEVLLDESHGRGSCNGDSGGPAFVERSGALVLFGVTSRGDGACAQEGIYTNIPTHTAWLAQATQSLRQQQ